MLAVSPPQGHRLSTPFAEQRPRGESGIYLEGRLLKSSLSMENTFPVSPWVSRQLSLQKSPQTEGCKAPCGPAPPSGLASPSVSSALCPHGRAESSGSPFTQVL